MTYKVLLSPHAIRNYKKLSTEVKEQIQDAINSLAHNPVSGSKIKRLRGRLKEYYRSRSGDYRIVYTVDRDSNTVFVDYIQHRRDVYRDSE